MMSVVDARPSSPFQLLKNIIDTSNGKANGNAPSLDMLYNQVSNSLSHRDRSSKSDYHLK
jgi:hypothetical protein